MTQVDFEMALARKLQDRLRDADDTEARDIHRAIALVRCMWQDLGERDFALFMRCAVEGCRRRQQHTSWPLGYDAYLAGSLRSTFGEELDDEVSWAFLIVQVACQTLHASGEEFVDFFLRSVADAADEPLPAAPTA
ncbi:hypothetical protein ACH4PU_30525 [Streptomyces sp. NPDC021100]|uniref:hypothetical protein n=1 Tax=Streptomyces sp. NPDC021100 TaxID=3365114 RepID=UPI003799CAD6